MRPVPFPEQNCVYAENQPGFRPLPAFVDHRQVISRWQLTFRERLTVLLTGKVWCRQQTFGYAPNGQTLQVETPFLVIRR